MKYAIIKFNFLSAVHFGTASGHLFDTNITCLSDTLFSSLYLECMKYAEKADSWLYKRFFDGKLVISDALPYNKNVLFIPKPALVLTRNSQRQSDSKQKKEFKRLKYISAENFSKYVNALKGNDEFDAEKENKLFQQILAHEERICVSIKGKEQPEPYEIATVRFAPKSGLYCIVGYTEEKDMVLLSKIFKSLETSGLGGRRSSGMGHFKCESISKLEKSDKSSFQALEKLLNQEEADYYMTLSASLPKEDEIENALKDGFYNVIKRSGFVDGQFLERGLYKKKNLFVLQSGACLKRKFAGDIYNVSPDKADKIYRYAKPLFVGVKL